MAYIPTEWQNGDVITAEKLNKLEEGIQAANIEKWTVVFDDLITTTNNGGVAGLFTPTAPIAGDSILVKFENIVYELPKITLSFGTGYGEFDDNNNPILTNYPCAIGIVNNSYYFFTLEGNTYKVEIKIKNKEDNDIIYVYAYFTQNGLQNMSKTVQELVEELVFAEKAGIALIKYHSGGFGPPEYFTMPLAYNTGGTIKGYFTSYVIDTNTIHFTNYTLLINYNQEEINLNIDNGYIAINP